MKSILTIATFALLGSTGWSQDTTSTASGLTDLDGTTGMNTTYGPTGLINVPSAFTARFGEARIGGSWGKDLSGPSLNYGILRWFEVGAVVLDRNNMSNKTLATGKLTIIPSNIDWLTIGIGTIDPFDAINSTFYVMGSADINTAGFGSSSASYPIGLRLHFGVGNGIFRERLIGGAEVLFSDRFSIIGEYDAKNFNTSLRYKSSNDVQLQAGIRDKGIFLGITSSVRF